jgi:autotransporter-associated beta strand protein
MKTNNPKLSLFSMLAICLLVAAQAQADKWKADNGFPLNQAASWTNNAVPTSTEYGVWSSIIAGPMTNSLGANLTWGGITILNPGGPIGISAANTLTLVGVGGVGIDMSAAIRDLSIGCSLNIPVNQSWNVQSGVTLSASGSIGGVGQLVKTGGGLLSLNGTNSYSGGTIVSNGWLLINGINLNNNGIVAKTNATLGGTGVIGGAVTVEPGAAITPGIGGIGTLTVSNSVTLSGTAHMEINRNANPSSDKISLMSSIGTSFFDVWTLTSQLIVSNSGPALQSGDTFSLFSADSYSGGFASIILPPLGTNLTWITSNLLVNGTISVGDEGCVPPVITNQPQSILIDACVSNPPAFVTFTVGASGTGLRYEWRTSTDGIIFTLVAGGNGASLTLPVPTSTQRRWLYVRIFNDCGQATSVVVQFTFVAASTPAAVWGFDLDCVNHRLCLTFNKALVGSDPPPTDALDPLNYLLDSGLGPMVTSAAFGGAPNVVCLTLDSALSQGTHTLEAVVMDYCESVTSITWPFNVNCPPCQPPEIVIQPQSQTVFDCGSVTFTVGVSGTEPITYQWYQNGMALMGGNSASYTKSPVSLGDNGSQFYVVACNPCGCATSQVAVLTVVPDLTPPAVVSMEVDCDSNRICLKFSEPLDPLSAAEFANYAVNHGETVSLVEFTPPDSVCLTLTPPLNPSLSYILSIQHLKDLCGNTMADNIEFSCITCIPPAIVTQPVDQTVLDCRSVTFSATASGTPPLTYQWYKDGAVLAGGDSASYTQSPVSLADNGSLFYVVVCNPCGCVTSRVARLTVIPDTMPPAILSASVDCTNNRICFTFTEPLTPASAEDTSHYTIDHGILIDTAALTAPETVCLKLDDATPLITGVPYTIALMGISDLCGNLMEGLFQFVCPITNCIEITCSDIVTNSCTNLWIDFQPAVTSRCCLNWSVTCTPPSGSVFAPGSVTTVICTADDHCGHTATCSFDVTVHARKPLNLYNTGVDSLHQLLPPKASDPHYEFLLNPSGTGTQPKVVQNNYLFGAWMTNNAVSQWIGPQDNGSGVNRTNYGYRLTFRVCCTNDVTIQGQWAVDNAGTILLNGNQVPGATLQGEVWNNFATWHPFTITSGFVKGQNTLDFWVTNYSSYTGLRVQFAESFECCSNGLQILCPQNMVFDTWENQVMVEHCPVATNSCCTNVTITCNPPCPGWFSAGTTAVVCTANDQCGNSASCQFTVTVNRNSIHMDPVPNNGGFIINWPVNEGWILQKASAPEGLWFDVIDATPPYSVQPTQPNQFYRLRKS